MTLRRPFRISAGTSTRVEEAVATLDIDGTLGYGEASPSPRVTGEDAATCKKRLLDWAERPDSLEQEIQRAAFEPGGSSTPAARAALTAAGLDAQGRRSGVPLHRLLNLPTGSIDSSITVSLGPPEAALAEAAEYEKSGWKVFKVKLGGPDDEAVISALRDRYPEKRLRVDANEAWSPQTARGRLRMLERHGVELVEQPLPRDLLAESAQLAKDFEIPIVLDEPLLDHASALTLVASDAGDGANIKLAKCGGPYEARRIVKVLRDAGWKVMMGCNLETRLGIATAAAFAGVLDWADLDSHELLADDPFKGFETPQGRVETPERPGIGVTLGDAGRLIGLR